LEWLGFGLAFSTFESRFMDWVHLHLALNHLPVVGILFVFGLLLLGICRGSEELKRLSLQLCVAMFVIGMGVKFSGEQSAERLFPDPSAEMKAFIQSHENSADQAVTGGFLLFVLAGIGLYRSRRTRILPVWATLGCTVLCLLTLILLGRTANLGGQIAHPEIRESVDSTATDSDE